MLEGGRKSWEGPSGCRPEFECHPDAENHIHCDGPLKGDAVSFFHKMSGKKSTGIVEIHWHYESCMLTVAGSDGETYSLCPSLGDKVLA